MVFEQASTCLAISRLEFATFRFFSNTFIRSLWRNRIVVASRIKKRKKEKKSLRKRFDRNDGKENKVGGRWNDKELSEVYDSVCGV